MYTSLYLVWISCAAALLALALLYARGCGCLPVTVLALSIVMYLSINCLDQEITNYHMAPSSVSPESWASHKKSGKFYCVMLPLLPVDYHDVLSHQFEDRSMSFYRKHLYAREQIVSFVVRWKTIASAMLVLGVVLVAHAARTPRYLANTRLRNTVGVIVASLSVGTWLGNELSFFLSGYDHVHLLHPLSIMAETVIAAGEVWGIPLLIISVAAAVLMLQSHLSLPVGGAILFASQFCVGWCLMKKWTVIRYMPHHQWALLGRCALVVAVGWFMLKGIGYALRTSAGLSQR